MLKKIISFLMAFCFISISLCNVAYATDSIPEGVTEEEFNEVKEFYSYYFELYYSKIGRINESGNYEIINPDLLKQEADKGDPGAQYLYNEYLNSSSDLIQPYGVWEVLTCAATDQFAPLLNLIEGHYIEGISSALINKAWGTAGEILAQALFQASKAAGWGVKGIFAAGSLAVSIYQCRDRY